MNKSKKENHYIESILSSEPFVLDSEQKSKLFDKAMNEAFQYHMYNNKLFKNYCDNIGFSLDNYPSALSDYPYIPVNIFKNQRLTSVPSSKINAILNSSATSGVPSSIAIDTITSKRQSFASAKVMSSYLGGQRRPFLILDEDPLKSTGLDIPARAAATRGFLILSNQPDYFLYNENGNLNLECDRFVEVLRVYEKQGKEICIFGFTYILYEHVVKVLLEKGFNFNLKNNLKIAHIGGWKKLESQKVSKTQFLDNVSKLFGIDEENIFDIYGFTEQMGLIYISEGGSPKKVPAYSEIIIRDFQTLEPVADGEKGLIQILTPLPNSYPGISVITEDVGKIINRGKDKHGRYGTEFEVLGRAKKAEARGCGDIMAEYIS